MPLRSADLRQALRPLFDPSSMPSEDAIRAWCEAYASYAGKAIAGPVTLPTGIQYIPTSGEFFTALDSAFRAMWTAAKWIGPGVTAVTAVVPPLQPYFAALSPAIMSSYDPEVAPSLIAEALHTYTLSITVTVTPATGTPFIVTLA